ncbi:MAG TPA: TIGR03618 family F420-dependent PPOX class oxidoreductase [Dehalococcoidia bacterium]|nr:TIGR03618 family F420-dependent PPOX class oxidoreductase [Dehalococcoidia bacterium]
MIGTTEQDAFVREHKYSVVTTLRADGSPTNSVIFTIPVGDTDELFFSTTADRLKTRTVENDNRIAVSFLDEGPPYRFVTVEGTAVVQREDVVDLHVALNLAMRGGDFTPPDDFAEILAKQGRVIIRITAERVSGVTAR